MLYLPCQTIHPAFFAGKHRRIAIGMGGVCESTPRLVNRPDSPTLMAFLFVKNMIHKFDKGGKAFCKAAYQLFGLAFHTEQSRTKEGRV